MILVFAFKTIMPRIAGVNIPDNKRIEISLTYIYGIGRVSSKKILAECGIDPNLRAFKLTSEEINHIKEVIDKHNKIEGDLRKEIMMAVKRLKDINCWKGMRHAKRLPVRGQRTKTNSRTVRGNVRKTVSSGKKAPPAPK